MRGKSRLYFSRKEMNADRPGSAGRENREYGKRVRWIEDGSGHDEQPVSSGNGSAQAERAGPVEPEYGADAVPAADGRVPGKSTGNVLPGDKGRNLLSEEKASVKSKLREEQYSSANEAAKLRFTKADNAPVEKSGAKKPRPVRNTGKKLKEAVTSSAHRKAAEYEDDNVGVEAANRSGQAVETTTGTVENVRYGAKLRAYRQAGKTEKQTARQEMHAMYEKRMAMNPEAASNPISRWKQKNAIKREYEAARKGAAAGRAASGTSAAGSSAGSFASSIRSFFGGSDGKGIFHMIAESISNNRSMIVILGLCAMVFMTVSGTFSSCAFLLQGGSEAVMSATFTAADDDILGADADYRAMEAELRREIAEIESENSGYDEYRYNITEIGHNPYELAAFLTVLYEDYTREEVQETLRALFEAQYSLSTGHSIETVTETRTVRVGESLGEVVTSGYCNCELCCGSYAGGATASGVMPTAEHTIAVDMYDPLLPFGTKVVMNGIEYVVEDTGPLTRYGVTFDVYYDDHDVAEAHGHQLWEAFLADDNGDREVEITQTTTKRIFSVDLDSTSLSDVIAAYDLTAIQRARYGVLLSTKGNKDYLFADDIYANASPGSYPDYCVPSAALSDIQFANMIHEAERYIGYPYVWGGDCPETSFDCSGFISWVINNCGNGWDVGRMTANELCEYCVTVSPSEAKPGDLVFFQGTYDTDGASHVGLYVGDGMMLHCGNPIHYSSLSDDYWQIHFRSFGRIP